MRPALFALLCLLYSSLTAQNDFMSRLAAIDALKSDSAALPRLEALHGERLSKPQRLQVTLRIARISSRLQQFTKSLLMGNEGLAQVQGSGNDSLEAAFDIQLGAAYYFMDQRVRAVPYFEKAAALSAKSGAWILENKALNNLGGTLTDLKEPLKAEPYMLKAIEVMNAHGHGEDHSTLLSYRVLGELYSRLKQDGKAKSIYLKLLEKLRGRNDTALLADVLNYYANILFREGKTDSALVMSEQALNLSRSKKMFHELNGVLMLHANILQKAGRNEEAVSILREVINTQRQSFTKDLDKQVSELEVRYKTAQMKKEKELAEEGARKQKWIYLLSFTAILVVLGALVYAIVQKRSSRQKAAAHRQRLEALVEGEEKERGRIARDLHDGIVQDLTAIKLGLGAGGNAPPAMVSELDKATRELRDIAYQMMPVALREYGLVSALEQLLAKTLTPGSIHYDFETVGLEERLPEKIEVCLYRITQELLNNVVKHSSASAISLVLTRYRDAVSLVLEDNGRGFKEAEIKKGIGMNSLSSRLEMVNGKLRFEASEGSGTMAIVKIPLA